MIRKALKAAPADWLKPSAAMKAALEPSIAAINALKTLVPEKQKRDRPGRPASGKIRVTMLLDPATVSKFKATGPGWQSRMNDALKASKL